MNKKFSSFFETKVNNERVSKSCRKFGVYYSFGSKSDDSDSDFEEEINRINGEVYDSDSEYSEFEKDCEKYKISSKLNPTGKNYTFLNEFKKEEIYEITPIPEIEEDILVNASSVNSIKLLLLNKIMRFIKTGQSKPRKREKVISKQKKVTRVVKLANQFDETYKRIFETENMGPILLDRNDFEELFGRNWLKIRYSKISKGSDWGSVNWRGKMKVSFKPQKLTGYVQYKPKSIGTWNLPSLFGNKNKVIGKRILEKKDNFKEQNKRPQIVIDISEKTGTDDGIF